jgi:hypothetical protein
VPSARQRAEAATDLCANVGIGLRVEVGHQAADPDRELCQLRLEPLVFVVVRWWPRGPRVGVPSEPLALMEGRVSKNVEGGAAARDDTTGTIGPIRWTR